MNKREFVTFKIGRNRYRKVFLEEILYLKADRTYTIVKTSSTELVLSEPLKIFNPLFANQEVFVRVNRSYIINMQRCVEVKNCTKPEIIMEDDEIVYPNTEALPQIMDYFDIK